MFWTLLLCHLVADYPLQSDAIVNAKKRLPGLAWHVGIHFVTMSAILFGLAGIRWSDALPAIFVLTVCHFFIDLWKTILDRIKPAWGVFTYLQDQALHLISIFAVTYWIEKSGGPPMVGLEMPQLFPAISYILVTHAWFITEKILSGSNPDYQRWVMDQGWSRMVGRAVMFSAFLTSSDLWGVLVFSVGMTYHWLDLRGPYRYRALVTDGAAVVAVVLFSSSISSFKL